MIQEKKNIPFFDFIKVYYQDKEDKELSIMVIKKLSKTRETFNPEVKFEALQQPFEPIKYKRTTAVPIKDGDLFRDDTKSITANQIRHLFEKKKSQIFAFKLLAYRQKEQKI